jgi:hypothetical protein
VYVEQCVLEFDKVDRESFSFRYENETGQQYSLDFAKLLAVMEHVQSVFHALSNELTQIFLRNIGPKVPGMVDFFGYEPR